MLTARVIEEKAKNRPPAGQNWKNQGKNGQWPLNPPQYNIQIYKYYILNTFNHVTGA